VKEDKMFPGVVGFVVGIVFSAIALDYYGYIRHSQPSDSALIEDFRLLTLKPGYDLKVSHKPSGKIAFCSKGYLLMKPDNEKAVAGVLVDEKDRGITCEEKF